MVLGSTAQQPGGWSADDLGPPDIVLLTFKIATE
jgi:hypothetical protein